MINFYSFETFMASTRDLVQERHPEESTRIEITPISIAGNYFLPQNPHVGVTKSSHLVNFTVWLTTKQTRKKYIDMRAYNTLRWTFKDMLFKLSKDLSKTQNSELISLAFCSGVEEEFLSVLDVSTRLRFR